MIGPILANFAFFVKLFLREIAKNVKTGSILANFAFFVKVISQKKRCCYRSAGACPPRSTNLNENRPQSKRPWTFAVKTEAWRGPVPRPTVKGEFWLGEGQALALRFGGAVWIAEKEKAY